MAKKVFNSISDLHDYLEQQVEDALQGPVADYIKDELQQSAAVNAAGPYSSPTGGISDIDSMYAFMAGMIGVMYDYDSETDHVVKELSDVFPTLDIYDNGVIKVSASHNQGLAGDKLWPYEVYKYDTSTDTYKYFAMVDAWDKSLSEKDYEGNTFPDDVDTDKIGVVYYVTEGGNVEKKAISQKDYEKWEKELIGGANKLEIDYKKFTKENVDSI